MKPIEFKEQNTVYGKDQKEYQPLPALRSESGEVLSCWKLSWKELLRLIFTRKIWVATMTFNQPLQPQYVTTDKYDIIPKDNA